MFGMGIPIYERYGIGTYCVNCGVKGSFHIVGSLSASIADGVREQTTSFHSQIFQK